jgi:hypothetical protein
LKISAFFWELSSLQIKAVVWEFVALNIKAFFFEHKYILLGVFLLADKSSVLGVLYLKTEVVELHCRHSDSSHLERLRLNPKITQVRVNLQVLELYGYT